MTPQPILIDDEATWPATLVETLEAALPDLRRFEEIRREHDARIKVDVMFRLSSSANPFSSDERARHIRLCYRIGGRDIVGFHCTRLHSNDLVSIQTIGLQPLNPALQRSRIDYLVSSGAMSPAVAARLKENNDSRESSRAGEISFIFTRALLRDESGVGRLFRSWGGEALYRRHEGDKETGPILRAIGLPYLVQVFIPVSNVKVIGDIGERMLCGFLERRGIDAENRGETEGCVRAVVRAERITAIHRLGDKAFAELTQCATWQHKLP
jgi:hypothetical protein